MDDLLGRVWPVAVYDLTDRLLSWEAERGNDTEPFDVVRAKLVDVHLPKLVEAGLVDPVDGQRYELTEAGLTLEANARGIDLAAVEEDPEWVLSD
ncbi:hypothetical protein [Halomarina rubra]|uniref:Uncharacterized protein n=1 Tax=Halomarina rubra TaxID=2071873 RepID=A0ABD6ATK2_9EURY|nr:hypothetical protein [Halomarina rubra]